MRYINDIILVSLLRIGEKGGEANFEQVVQESFKIAPKALSLRVNSKWPDVRKVESALERLKRKKLVKGGSVSCFSLTKQGRKQAQEIAKTFRQKKLL